MRIGTALAAALLHAASQGACYDAAWTPWTMQCNIKVTNPAQNTAFSPSIPVT